MSTLFYKFFLALYSLGIRLSAPSNPKARLWLNGRKDWRRMLAQDLQQGERRIWIHCSSLGEFEQGRPLIEMLRAQYPGYKIVLTFFSPSGYEPRKNYEGADYILYLPMDGPANARDFITAINPSLAIFVKYEFWHYYLHQLRKRGIPTILVSAAFRSSQSFFQWHGGFFRSMLHCFSHIHVQDEHSSRLLRSIGISGNVSISGDTRYDRVAAIRAGITAIPEAEAFKGDGSVLIAGSTWPGDEAILHQALTTLPPHWKLIIAPHEIDAPHIAQLRQLFGTDAVLFSVLRMEPAQAAKRVLIIDNMGMLSSLYAYGEIAWVGGGFETGGIHNTLEPAVFGLPIIMGPTYRKFVEAVKLVDLGAAFAVHESADALTLLQKLSLSHDTRREVNEKLQSFMTRETGAAQRILHQVASAGYLAK